MSNLFSQMQNSRKVKKKIQAKMEVKFLKTKNLTSQPSGPSTHLPYFPNVGSWFALLTSFQSWLNTRITWGAWGILEVGPKPQIYWIKTPRHLLLKSTMNKCAHPGCRNDTAFGKRNPRIPSAVPPLPLRRDSGLPFNWNPVPPQALSLH